MPAVSRHVFVCTAAACNRRGAEETYRYLKKRVKETAGLEGVWVNRSGSVGGCEHGPMVVLYPEGVWYFGVTKERVDELIERHLQNGEVIEAWRFHQTGGCPCNQAEPGGTSPLP